MNIRSAHLIGSQFVHGSVAIDNLRAVVVLMVIGVHTALAYAAYAATGPWAFDAPPYLWRTFPIIDPHRFLGFDIFCAWANVFLMPLFFLVSGLFVWNSLERNGARRFARRRVLRLGPPFLLGIAVIMPIAIYPAYAERTLHPQIGDYLHQLIALPFWPDGPMWFLWVLLLFDLAVAGLFAASRRLRAAVARLGSHARREPIHFLMGFLLLSAFAYVPLGTIFGPMRWFQWGPFSFQLNFIALYAVYFGAGVVIGAAGLECGPLHPYFARRWKKYLLAAAVTFFVWLLVSAKTFTHSAPSVGWMLADAIALVPACFACSFCFLLLALQFGRVRARLLQNLRANAFGMYWVHYAVVTWAQFALLVTPLPAIAKALVVFVSATCVAWVAAAAIGRIPMLNGMIGAPQRAQIRTMARAASLLPLSD